MDNTECITVDGLAERFLSPEVEKAFPKVELEIRDLGVGFEMKGLELKEFRVVFHLRGLTLALFIMNVTAFITGVGIVVTLLATR